MIRRNAAITLHDASSKPGQMQRTLTLHFIWEFSVMVFEICCYIVASLAVLTLYGIGRRETAPTVQAIDTALEQIDGMDCEADLSAMEGMLEPDPIETMEEVLETFARLEREKTTPVIADRVVPFTRPVKRIDYSALNSYQLRAECSLRGIRWRNAHGKNRHLSAKEMRAALTA